MAAVASNQTEWRSAVGSTLPCDQAGQPKAMSPTSPAPEPFHGHRLRLQLHHLQKQLVFKERFPQLAVLFARLGSRAPSSPGTPALMNPLPAEGRTALVKWLFPGYPTSSLPKNYSPRFHNKEIPDMNVHKVFDCRFGKLFGPCGAGKNQGPDLRHRCLEPVKSENNYESP